MGVLAGAANLYFLYKFIKILTTPWEQSDAYKLGIVDENGKILIKKNKLKGSEQKEAYTMMHRFVWKMKRLMEKIPFGKSRLASYAAALWFIKEQNNFSDDSDDQLIQESFLSFLETDWKNDALILKENYEGDMDKKTFEDLHEGLKDLPPHLQKLVKKIEKRQKDWNKQNPTAKVKTLVYNPKTGKPDIEIEEKAPPGWEKTVKKMKKNKEIDNPYALAWYMANKGDKPEEWENHTIGEHTKKRFAERIFEATVLSITDVDQWTTEIYKGIKAGWKSVAKSTLGGDKNVAILIKLTLEAEKDWPHKILQNATYGMIRIGTDGTMEMFASDRKVKNMRKTRIKSAKDVVSKINTWIKQVDEDVVLDEKKSDYEDEISAFKKKGGKVKKMKPGKSFKSFFKQKGPKKPPRQEEVEIDEEVFNWYIIKGNKEKGKVAHVGTERQLKLKIRKPTFPPNHVLAKSRKDLRIGDKWKATMGVYEGIELEEAVLAGRDYKYDGKVVKISKKNFRQVHKDFKGTTKGKETMLVLDPKSGGTILVPVQFEEVELDEMPNRANMEKINSLIKKHSGKFKWRDEVLYVDKRIEKDVTSLIKKGGLTATIKVSSDPMKEGFTTFTSYLNEGRPAGKIRGDDNTPTNIERQKLVDSQEKNYTLKDIESIARKHKVRLHPLEHPMKFGSEWTIITDKNIKLIYNKRRNDTLVTGWRIDKKKLRQYKDKYENEETRIQDVEAGIGGGRLSLRGFESAFEVISEQLNEEAPANATGTAVVGTGDDTTVWKKKKIRKNAKVETEEFGGKKVFVVSSDKFYNARMGKSRYSRYEKYVGNDKLGETIRQYGRENPKSPIILKNSDTGAMLYLKYGTRV